MSTIIKLTGFPETMETENTTLKTYNQMLCFELGTLDHDQVIQLFQRLIDTGVVWQLQGFYGRTARDLINSGLCNLPQR